MNPLQSREGLGLVNSPILQSSALSMSRQILQNHKRPAVEYDCFSSRPWEENGVTDSELFSCHFQRLSNQGLMKAHRPFTTFESHPEHVQVSVRVKE